MTAPGYDEDDVGRVTWTPKVGAVFKGHGPGAKFTPDGTGGGTLSYQVVQQRRGFRPKLVTVTVPVEVIGAPEANTEAA